MIYYSLQLPADIVNAVLADDIYSISSIQEPDCPATINEPNYPSQEGCVKAQFLEWYGDVGNRSCYEVEEHGIIKGNWFYRQNGTKKYTKAKAFRVVTRG